MGTVEIVVEEVNWHGLMRTEVGLGQADDTDL
jgi:hypothetical protein